MNPLNAPRKGIQRPLFNFTALRRKTLEVNDKEQIYFYKHICFFLKKKTIKGSEDSTIMNWAVAMNLHDK